MEYWRGMMDWPLDPEWTCEVCGYRGLIWGLLHRERWITLPEGIVISGYRGLIWGLVHGVCRCVQCHVQYAMRDSDGQIVDVPIVRLKTEYDAPAKSAWAALHIPVDKLTDEQWNEHGAPVLD